MKHIELLAVYFDPGEGVRRKVGRLARKDRQILFEYEGDFVLSGLQLSPFKLPLAKGVVIGDPAVFGGLMGVFEDSLPDGWGRLLLDRRLAQLGMSASALSPLDRLAWVGSHAMGALSYEPEYSAEIPVAIDLDRIAADARLVLEDAKGADLEALLAVGGSPQGARPKALVQINRNGKKIIYGAQAIEKGFTPFLVKFRAKNDDQYAGALEHSYAQMAGVAGIILPETRLLGRSKKNPGYFAVQRFDRIAGGRRMHMHTLSGLLHAPHHYPTLTYRDLLLVTRQLTRDESCVSQMFRRTCFNVFARNRDDHAKNFAFLMDAQGKWTVSPAYDLTFSEGMGGEHMLLVGKEGKNPTDRDLKELATEVGVKHPKQIIEEVKAAVVRFDQFADEAGLPKKVRLKIAQRLRIPS